MTRNPGSPVVDSCSGGVSCDTPAASAASVMGPRAGSLPTSSPRTDRLSRFDGVTAITG